jgi:hypothetical protein
MEKLAEKNWFNIIAGIMLLLAIPAIWPYGYFQILRWVISVVAIHNAYEAHKLNKKNWIYTMVAVVILFNPIFPFFFSKQIWIILDLVTSVIMFISFSKINIDNEYIKYIQAKEREINARKAATWAFLEIIPESYNWPVEDYEIEVNGERGLERETHSRKLDYKALGQVPRELVESLLKGTLASDNPEQTQYAKIQEFFDRPDTSWQSFNSFAYWQYTTDCETKNKFYEGRKVFNVGILILSVILIALYCQNK